MKWLDSLRQDAREMRAGMVVGAVVDDRTTELKKQPLRGLSQEEFAEYEQVAAAIGFAPRGLKSDALRQFLSESGILAYPTDKVNAHLTKQYGAPKERTATWCWRPLRSQDQGADTQYQLTHGFTRGRLTENGLIGQNETPYGKPVPFPVLLTVKRILDKFPNARFFVSDEYSAPPVSDPFLAVLYGEDSTPVVIERWDEPTFRG